MSTNVADIQKNITNLLKIANEAKLNISKLEGQEDEILRQLKQDLDLNSVKEAEIEKIRLSKLIEKEKGALEKAYENVRSSYDW